MEDRVLRRTTYRLYPSPKQVALLYEQVTSHQQLYNAALEERIGAWCKAGKPSQRCPACWDTKKKTLDQRRHVCACGADLDRDESAATVMAVHMSNAVAALYGYVINSCAVGNRQTAQAEKPLPLAA